MPKRKVTKRSTTKIASRKTSITKPKPAFPPKLLPKRVRITGDGALVDGGACDIDSLRVWSEGSENEMEP